jgi:PDZ domain
LRAEAWSGRKTLNPRYLWSISKGYPTAYKRLIGGRPIAGTVGASTLGIGAGSEHRRRPHLPFLSPTAQLGLGRGALDIQELFSALRITAEAVNDSGSGGARVTKVNPGGPAERAQIKENDIVVEVGDRKVNSVDELTVAVRQLKIG